MRLLCHHPTLEFLWMWDSLPYYQLSLFSVVRYFSDNRPLQQTCSNRTVFHGIHPDVTSQDSICHFMAVLFHYISLLSLCFNILCFDGPCRLLGRRPRMQSNSHVWMNRWIGLLKLPAGLPQLRGWLLWRLSRTKCKANFVTQHDWGSWFSVFRTNCKIFRRSYPAVPLPQGKENRLEKAHRRFQRVLFPCLLFHWSHYCNLYITHRVSMKNLRIYTRVSLCLSWKPKLCPLLL